jgi:EpsI family protein
MTTRALMLAVCFVLTSAYLGYASRAEPTPIRQSLSALPLEIGEWRGRLEAPLSEQILAILRVDDYTTRSYFRPGGAVGFYVGYHATQRQGASIHSPLNCLPGAGWIPAQQGRLVLTVYASPSGPPRRIEVNRVIIEKGVDRQLVLYWYQSHGRVVASEYWGKIYSVADAIRWNRTDAALVRVIAPIGSGGNGLEQAEHDATGFVRELFPLLTAYLPS